MTMTATATSVEQSALPKQPMLRVAVALAACAVVTIACTAAALFQAGLVNALPEISAAMLVALVLAPVAAGGLFYRHGALHLIRGFTERNDSEQEQIVVRLLLATLVLAYSTGLVFLHPGDRAAADTLVIVTIGILLSWGFILHLIVHPGRYPWRKQAAMVVDVGFLSFYLHTGGELTAFWYPIYLWVTFGNGFRYGLKALFQCAAFSVAAFSAVIVTTPAWSEHPEISIGLLLALIVLPAYVSTLIRSLREAKAQAEKANAAKSRFLATMSHELRTPLNAMIGMGSVFPKANLDPDQRDILATMQSAAKTLLGLINDVLDFSRIEAGKLRPDVETFDLHELVSSTLGMLRPQTTGLRIIQRVDPRLPCHIRGWPQQLRQILINLVANAIKFTEHGSVTVQLELASPADAAPRLRLVVADQGIGMSPETLAQIFQPFTQADGSVTRRYGGTGLGLAIVHQLVDLMGGTIAVRSTLGQGSTFTVEVPIEPDPAAVETIALAGTHIVIAGRDAARADALSAILRNWGAEPKTVEDARTLDQTPAQPQRVVLILDARSASKEDRRPLNLPTNAAWPIVVLADNALEGMHMLEETGSQRGAAIDGPMDETLLLRAIRSVVPAPDSAASEPDDTAPQHRPQRCLKVLVAEDNPVNRKVIARVLGIAGHEAHVVDDGEAALAALDDGDYDIALLDINMPKMSGYEVTKFYRMISLGERALPILALTADVTPETRRLCQEAGMDAVLTKPVDARRLIETIQDMVGAHGEATEAEQEDGLPEGVTPIDAHPRFAKQSSPVVNERTLAALESLGGGSDFLEEVVETFRADAREVIDRLTEAAMAADASAFRDYAHSLRSSAANVGATRLCEALLAIRGITDQELRRNGAAHVAVLKDNFESLDRTLEKTVRELAK